MTKSPRTQRLLIVDDDRWLLDSMIDWLGGQGFAVTGTTGARRRETATEGFTVRRGLAGCNLDGEDGFELLAWCRKHVPDLPVVMISGYAGPDAGVDAIASGAIDLLSKPVIDQELLFALRRAISQSRIADENKRLKEELDRRTGLETVLSHDSRMMRIFDVIESVADTRAIVLITGENGMVNR